ncbi:MAG: sensor domain-containing diguanylate cyclase [Campylobacterota bacterium]|nr:sensor domain-containing diguanylate cyclase [Campylobacterota bacterium]
MQGDIQLKDYSYFLRVNRNDIIDRWLICDDINNIFLKHSIKIDADDKKIFYDLFDCMISVMQWNLTIAECPVKIKFLKFLDDNLITTIEFFTFINSLKNILLHFFYEKESFSFGLLKNIESIMMVILNELYETYEHMKEHTNNFTDDHSNLLNEYKKAVDISTIVSKSNPKGIITYVNNKFCEVSGYSKNELIGKPHSIVRHPCMPSATFKDLWDTIKTKKPWTGIITNMKADGQKYVVDSTVIPILDIDGDIVEYIAIRYDVTEFEQTKEQLSNLNRSMKNKVDELYNMTTTLEEQASVDKLTGVFNRRKFEDIFEHEIEKSRISKNFLSMIVVDIDHFKSVNDNYGHNVGDDVLKEVANLISNNIKRLDIFARWGGEEFVVLLPNNNIKEAGKLAEKLRILIEEDSFSIVGKLTISLGVASYHNNDSKTDFFERADKSLYKAKTSGRNKVMIAE